MLTFSKLLLELADSKPLDAVFSVFVMAVVGVVGFLVLRYGRATPRTRVGSAPSLGSQRCFQRP